MTVLAETTETTETDAAAAAVAASVKQSALAVSFEVTWAPNLDERVHRADPALGSTDLKTIVTRSPLHFRHDRTTPRKSRTEWDVGTAGHSWLFGGAEPTLVTEWDPADPAKAATDWRSPRARSRREELRAAGAQPLTVDQYDEVHRWVDVVLAHPDAAELLTGPPEYAEISAGRIIPTPSGPVPCKARYDRLHPHAVVDAKFLADVSPRAISGALAKLGYGIQAGAYRDVLVGTDSTDTPAHVLVCVEKDPPYAVSVVKVGEATIRRGQDLAAEARQRWADCTQADAWPAYLTGIGVVDAPGWWFTDDIDLEEL